MPINYPGFNADPNIKNDFSAIGDILPNMLAGYKAGLIPQQMRMERQKQELANALTEQQTQNLKLTNQFLPQTTEADISYKNAMANKANIDSSPLSVAGKGLSGDPRNAFQLQIIKKMVENNPELQPYYEYVMKAYDLERRNKESTINYKDSQRNTAGARSASPLGKKMLELDDIKNGFRPNTNRQDKLTPEEQKDLQGKYELSVTKDITTSNILNRNANAANIVKTLEEIDPKVLSSYSGVWGGIANIANKSVNPLGGESKNYDSYKNNLESLGFLRDQVRLFFQDSVQTQAKEDLEELLNPTSWLSNPAQAEAMFNKAKGILYKELATYQSLAHNTDELKGKNTQPQYSNEEIERHKQLAAKVGIKL